MAINPQFDRDSNPIHTPFGVTTLGFTQPGVGASVVLSFDTVEFARVSQFIFADSAGVYQVTAVDVVARTVTAKNTGSDVNSSPGTVFPAFVVFGPSGPPAGQGIPAGLSLSIQCDKAQTVSGPRVDGALTIGVNAITVIFGLDIAADAANAFEWDVGYNDGAGNFISLLTAPYNPSAAGKPRLTLATPGNPIGSVPANSYLTVKSTIAAGAPALASMTAYFS